MKRLEYLKKALENKLPLKKEWVISMFTDVVKDNKILKRKDGKTLVILGEEYVELSDVTPGAILSFSEPITLTSDDMKCISGKITTTIGRMLSNYILIEIACNGKLEYVNHQFDIGEIESKILSKLKKDTEVTDDTISVSEYIDFSKAVSYLRGWVSFTVISVTERAMVPPEGIDEYKKKLIKEYKDTYGDDVFKDFSKLVEFENKLKDFDKEWLKDDPTIGIVTSSKIQNIARKKLFLTVGSEQGFSESTEAQTVENSLLEGWPNDKEGYSKMANSLRVAAYSRGQETQLGGVIAKMVNRSTLNMSIDVEDCNTLLGITLDVTDKNSKQLISRYYISNKKSILITEAIGKTLIGKTIELRSPMYCKAKEDSICKKCVGHDVAVHKNGILLMGTSMAGSMLNGLMKKSHGTVLSVYPYSIDSLID